MTELNMSGGPQTKAVRVLDRDGGRPDEGVDEADLAGPAFLGAVDGDVDLESGDPFPLVDHVLVHVVLRGAGPVEEDDAAEFLAMLEDVDDGRAQGDEPDAARDIDDVPALDRVEREAVAEGAAQADLVAGPELVQGPGDLADAADREVGPVVLGAERQGDGELPGPEDRAHDELPGPDPEVLAGLGVLEREIERPDVLDLVLDLVDDGDLGNGDDGPGVRIAHLAPALVISRRM